MRKIRFRGKRTDDGKWVYGYYVYHEHCSRHDIWADEDGEWYEVAPETVGQFTGLQDKNSKDIYKGDILHSKSWGDSRTKKPHHVVEWGRVGWIASGYNGEIQVNPDLDVRSDFEIIGNIHENKELLNQDK